MPSTHAPESASEPSAGERSCPACGSKSSHHELYFDDGPWRVARCGACGMVFLSNPPDVTEVATDYAWQRSYAGETESRREREPRLHALQDVIRPTVKRIRPNRLGSMMRQYFTGGRILDVGCGKGHRLRRQIDALRLPVVPFGIDLEAGAVKMAAHHFDALGGEAWCKPGLEGVSALETDSMDGALLYAYLEHEPEPRQVLKELSRVLKDGAPVIIKVPNHASLNRWGRGRRWCGYRLPDHVNYFTPRTLQRLLHETGFHVVRCTFVDREPLSDSMWMVARCGEPAPAPSQAARWSAWLEQMRGATDRVVRQPLDRIVNACLERNGSTAVDDERRAALSPLGRWLVAAVALLFVVTGVIAVERAVQGSSDFGGFYRAMDHLLHLRDLSDDGSMERYPPTFQIFHVPLLTLPLGVAAAVWTLLNLASCAWLPFAVRWLSGIRIRDQLLPWLAVSPLVIDNIVLGQSGVILLAAVTTALALARNYWPALGGAILGVAICFKALPVVFLAVPAYLGRSWRAVVAAGLAVVLLVATTMLWYGPREAGADFAEWAVDLRTEHTPYEMLEDGQSLHLDNQGVVITLVRTLTVLPADIAPTGPRLENWPRPVVYLLAALVTGAALLVWLSITLRLRGDPRPLAWLGLYAATGLGMLAVMPLVWTHYFIWIAPALLLLHRRPGLVGAFGLVSIAALAWNDARFVGVHMWMSLALLPLIWHQLFGRESRAPVGAVAAEPSH